MEIKFKKLHPDARIPTYATDGSAAFDLYAINGGRVTRLQPLLVKTGIAVEIPDDHVMLVFSRSGHGFNYGIRLANCVGVIDSDYRGELMAKLTADGDGCLSVGPGDRVAQGMILPVQRVSFVEAESLSETTRGIGGLGSTGA